MILDFIKLKNEFPYLSYQIDYWKTKYNPLYSISNIIKFKLEINEYIF